MTVALILAAIALLAPLSQTPPEATSLFGRPLMYKGLRSPESVLSLDTADDVQIATQGYGAGNWYLGNSDRAKAKEIFERILTGKAWTAFGYIAAEADLRRGF